MFKKINNKGFTLLEMLVVITIMGFLAAVLVPRLLSSLKSGENTGNQANIKEVNNLLQRWPVSMGGTINNPLSLVVANVPTDAAIVPENGGLAQDFIDRFNPRVYYLSSAESRELGLIGITSMQMWNSRDDFNVLANKGLEYAIVGLDETIGGTPVLMCGVSSPDATTNPVHHATLGEVYGDPDSLYKILVGFAGETIGRSNWMGMTVDGMQLRIEPGTGKISKSSGMYAQDFVVYALPRLASTLTRDGVGPMNNTFTVAEYDPVEDALIAGGEERDISLWAWKVPSQVTAVEKAQYTHVVWPSKEGIDAGKLWRIETALP